MDSLSRDHIEKSLSALGDNARRRLMGVVLQKDFAGRIDPAEVKALAEAERTSSDDLLIKLLPLARLYAYPPLSQFRVGVACQGFSGAIYLGANLEIPGQALFFSVHGEQSAITNAFRHGERGVSALAVTAAPCGHCRQFLYEMHNGSDLRIITPSSRPVTLATLLPSPFGPKDLGLKAALFQSEQQPLKLKDDTADPLVQQALTAAKQSYAPYTKSYSGIAVRTRKGHVYSGSYIENVAFNPSLPPLQASCVAVLFGGERLDEITSAVLVELDNATISHVDTTRAALGQLAHGASFQRALAHLKGP
jgi:cytidine deaminase